LLFLIFSQESSFRLQAKPSEAFFLLLSLSSLSEFAIYPGHFSETGNFFFSFAPATIRQNFADIEALSIFRPFPPPTLFPSFFLRLKSFLCFCSVG